MSPAFFQKFKLTSIKSRSYLISYPFILAATLHAYAGLLCFYLSQPAATRQFGQKTASAFRGAAGNTNTDTDEVTSNDSDRSLSSTSRHHQAGPITAESLGMNERLLRNALTHFEKALEREMETYGTAGPVDDGENAQTALEQDHRAKLRLAHGTAKVSQTFIDEVSTQRSQSDGS